MPRKKAPSSLRVSVLEDAADLTSGDRNNTYGDPSINLSCQGQLWEIYRRYSPPGKHSPAHDAAIQHALAKIARIACGRLHRDNYVDGACYLGIAFETEVVNTADRECKADTPMKETILR